MSTIIESLAALTIGAVETVSPDEIKVSLELEAPQATALNTGVPTRFPRLNGYVVIPNESGAVVGLVVWLGVERSAFPKRTGLKDFGLIDLPFPLRKISLIPIGTLLSKKAKGSKETQFYLERGVSVFPSVGDSVLLPTEQQLRSIIESRDLKHQIQIGTSPLAGNAIVSVDPDKLFGRHLAVLGNTGSGKSCSVAGLIRWSLEKAKQEQRPDKKGSGVNARFIVLDPNGEYSKTFDDLGDGVRKFQVPPASAEAAALTLPAWMWSSHEWSAFAHAAPGVQRPLLMQGLRDLRAGGTLQEPETFKLGRLIRTYKARFEEMIAQGISAYSGFPNNRRCGDLMRNLEQDATTYSSRVDAATVPHITTLIQALQRVISNRSWQTATNSGFNDFSETDIQTVLSGVENLLGNLPSAISGANLSEDAPIPFDVNQLSDHLEQIAAGQSAQASQMISTLTLRLRMMLADRRMGPIVVPSSQPTFDKWLTDYIGADGAKNGQIAVLDLSLVPADVLQVVIAVIARIIFEATQRYRKLNGNELPTVLVLEEAHNFIQRGVDEANTTPTPTQMCRQTFEKIAREGRKFGLGLVLSSQRPSELSPTVLAQCNTFLLHRIVNDRDQELVARLIPDNLGGLLKELPSLPARRAMLLGWATPVPILVEINEIPEHHRPRSSDPKFWAVWTGEEERKIEWDKIAKDWVS